jgi:gliding motility-associated-like protein
LSAGTYSVTLTDAYGCSIIKSTTITEPSELTINITESNISCFGANNGSASVVVSGGIIPYIYNWSNGNTSNNISDLSAGTYSLTVIDANNCDTITNITITEPAQIVIATSTTNAKCGYSDGTASVDNVSNAVLPVAFLWNSNPAQTTAIATNLTAGNYEVTVIDSNNCSASSSVIVGNIDGPVIDSITAKNVSCYGFSDGDATAHVSQGTIPYTYNWTGGNTESIISDLQIGMYYVTVTDINNCAIIDSIIISQPDSISISANYSGYICAGSSNGSISLSISGATSPYNYIWSNGSVSSELSDLNAGVYKYTITDAMLCSYTDSLIISEASPLELIPNIGDVTCYGINDGFITLNILGGVNPYNYSWSNGNVSGSINSEYAGNYSVTVTDGADCSISDTYAISQPDELIVTYESENITCYGNQDGSITILANGGIAPYSYNWSIENLDNDSLTGLNAGIYSLSLIDANNCQKTMSIEITQPQFPLLATAIVTGNNCNQDSIGSIDVTAYGGSGQYTYLWSDDTTNQDRNKLTGGYYSLTITDSDLCNYQTDFFVSYSEELIINLSSVVPTCNNSNNGIITTEIVNGVEPYQFIWSNGETTSSLNNLSSGAYTLTVTDANNCIYSGEITLVPKGNYCIEVFNVFTPNSDGTNDVWNIPGIENYPEAKVNIYNQWGKRIFNSDGYYDPWDGTFNGKDLPADSYFYIIDLGNDEKPISGSVSIIK